MTTPSGPMLAEPPREPDVAIVGAGTAGIAAARRCLAAGLSVALVEARQRVGGRAVTVPMRGHGVDLGAHWLHSGRANPLVRLAEDRGERLRRAPRARHVVIAGRPATAAERRARGAAFERADRILTQRAEDPQDRSAASALPPLGPWRDAVAAVHGLVSGRPLEEVSLKDFPSLVYQGNRFIAGGLGVLRRAPCAAACRCGSEPSSRRSTFQVRTSRSRRAPGGCAPAPRS